MSVYNYLTALMYEMAKKTGGDKEKKTPPFVLIVRKQKMSLKNVRSVHSSTENKFYPQDTFKKIEGSYDISIIIHQEFFDKFLLGIDETLISEDIRDEREQIFNKILKNKKFLSRFPDVTRIRETDHLSKEKGYIVAPYDFKSTGSVKDYERMFKEFEENNNVYPSVLGYHFITPANDIVRGELGAKNIKTYYAEPLYGLIEYQNVRTVLNDEDELFDFMWTMIKKKNAVEMDVLGNI